MTVCIVARSAGMLLCASDRMITSGDVQFEPPITKWQSLTPSIGVMYSGDANFFSEIVSEVFIEIRRRIELDPGDWLKVQDVANMYVKYRNEAKLRRAEAAILAPLNLDRNTFLTEQATMESGLVDKIAQDLINYPVPDLDVIIAGIDTRFGGPLPTIYTVHNDNLSSADAVGFAAIGSGSRHAESQFMQARYSHLTSAAEALLILYTAKRNAEVAPGVGLGTDLHAIGPELGQFVTLRNEIRDKLEEEFNKTRIKEDAMKAEAKAEVARYLNELGKAPVEEQATPSSPEGGTAIEAAQDIAPKPAGDASGKG